MMYDTSYKCNRLLPICLDGSGVQSRRMRHDEKIINNLRALIHRHGTTESALSKKAGLGHTAARDIISGKSSNPTARTLRKLAEAVGEDITALTGEATAHETGFAENQVEPWRGSDATDLKREDVLSTFARRLSQPEIFSANSAVPLLGILPGDLIVADMGARALTGDSVIVTIADLETGAAETMVMRYHPPFVLSGNPLANNPVFRLDQSGAVAIMGVVAAIVRDEASRRRRETT